MVHSFLYIGILSSFYKYLYCLGFIKCFYSILLYRYYSYPFVLHTGPHPHSPIYNPTPLGLKGILRSKSIFLYLIKQMTS